MSRLGEDKDFLGEISGLSRVENFKDLIDLKFPT